MFKCFVFIIGVVLLVIIAAVYAIPPTSVPQTHDRPPVDRAVFAGEHRIVYLIPADTNEKLVTADVIGDDLQAEVVHEWSDVAALHKQESLDALIVHGSALKLVDREWINHAYLNGVLIAGLRMGAQQLAQMTGVSSLASDDFGTTTGGYVMAQFSITGGTSEERAAIINAHLFNGSDGPPLPGIDSEVHVSTSKASDVLTGKNYHQFTQVLKHKLD